MRRRYSKLTIYLVTLVMGIGMITFPADDLFHRPVASTTVDAVASVTPTSAPVANNADAITPTVTPTPLPVVSPTPTPVPTLSPEENPLLDEVPDDIIALAQAYFDSRLTSIEDYRKLIYNDEYIDEELTYRRVEYIVAYHNLKCYLKKGVGIVDYVVYILNDAQIATIDTYAPSIDVLYMIYDEDGSAKVYLPGDDLTEEELLYYEALNAAEDVTALVADVNSRLAAAMESDANLRDFLSKISETVQ